MRRRVKGLKMFRKKQNRHLVSWIGAGVAGYKRWRIASSCVVALCHVGARHSFLRERGELSGNSGVLPFVGNFMQPERQLRSHQGPFAGGGGGLFLSKTHKISSKWWEKVL